VGRKLVKYIQRNRFKNTDRFIALLTGVTEGEREIKAQV
jgi:hypothetical protein